MTIRAAAALLTLLLSSATYVGSAPVTRQVQIGWGCIELPATSRVVWLKTSVIDQSYGYIDAAGHPRIEWSFGFSERHPLCHKK